MKIYHLCLLLVLVSTSSFAEKTKLTICADNSYPPYSYEQNGQIHGVYYDIITAALNSMPEYEVNIIPLPWKRGLKDLESGACFGLYPPYYRPKERPYIRAYSVPLLDETTVIMCRKDKISPEKKSLAFPSDYHDLTIGINLGFVILDTKSDTAVQKNIITARSSRDNIMALKHKILDCYANDRISILYQAKEYQYDTNDMIETTVLNIENGYLAISNANQYDAIATPFLEKFNKAFSDLKNTGKVKEILAEYLK